MKKAMLKTTLSLAVSLASTSIFANGFQLNEQSISGMGTGFAGRSSNVNDASIVYGNPAGMSYLKREQFTVGAAAIVAKTDISDASGTAGGSNDGDMVPTVSVPMGYYVKPLDDHWAIGAGIYAPFGLMTDYEGSFAGRYFADKSKVQVITFQPTISYAFNDVVSIGFGPTFNRIDGNLTARTANPFPIGGEGKADINGNDTAWGFNVGLLVRPTDSTSIGLTYHSKVSYHLDGHTKFEGGTFALAGIQGKYDAKLDLETPETADISITQKIDDRWTVYAGSTFTRWSRLESIVVENSGTPVPSQMGTISESENWHDVWSHAIGVSYQLNPAWVLRAGYTYDPTPTNNEDRSPRIPTGDRHIFSLGAGWNINDNVTVDLAMNYLREEKVDINLASATKGTYSASYENSAWGFGAGLTYRF